MLENEDGSKTIKLYEQDCYPGLQFELYGAEIFSCKESMQSEKLAYMDSSLADFDSSYRHVRFNHNFLALIIHSKIFV